MSNVTVYAIWLLSSSFSIPRPFQDMWGLDVFASFYWPIPRERPSHKLLAPYGEDVFVGNLTWHNFMETESCSTKSFGQVFTLETPNLNSTDGYIYFAIGGT
jgi:hypothetical protein